MVLDHVAQLAGLVEVAPAALDADGFGDGDLHMGNVVLVPASRTGCWQSAGRSVLHRVLAQVMIDAIGPVFREETRHRVIHLAGRPQVMADGLFQHDAGALGQPRLRQPGADRAVDGSRRGEDDDTFGLASLVRQRGVILAAAELHAQVVQTGQETLQNAFLEFALGHMATQVLGDQRQMRTGSPPSRARPRMRVSAGSRPARSS